MPRHSFCCREAQCNTVRSILSLAVLVLRYPSLSKADYKTSTASFRAKSQRFPLLLFSATIRQRNTQTASLSAAGPCAELAKLCSNPNLLPTLASQPVAFFGAPHSLVALPPSPPSKWPTVSFVGPPCVTLTAETQRRHKAQPRTSHLPGTLLPMGHPAAGLPTTTSLATRSPPRTPRKKAFSRNEEERRLPTTCSHHRSNAELPCLCTWRL